MITQLVRETDIKIVDDILKKKREKDSELDREIDIQKEKQIRD
jgi:hypothetical protein